MRIPSGPRTLAGAYHLYRSADIPVRFGAYRNEEADKNVRAPKRAQATGVPTKVRCARRPPTIRFTLDGTELPARFVLVPVLSRIMAMTSRERLAAALHHQTPDRVPVDFGGTAVTGMHVSAVSRLRQAVTSDRHYRVKVIEPYQMLGEIDWRPPAGGAGH